MNKKILLVSNTAWSIYNFRLGLMNFLRQKGFEPIAVAPSDEFVEKLKKAGFGFIGLNNLDRKGMNPLRDLALFFELRRIYKKENPAFILQYTIKPNVYGPLAAKLSKIKNICVITGLGYLFIKRPLVQKLGQLLYKASFLFSDRVIFFNPDDKKEFIEAGIVSEGKATLVKSSGVDVQYFSPVFCQKIKKDDNKTGFLLITRILSDKGIYEFIEAAKKVKTKYPDCDFNLLGVLDKDNPAAIEQNKVKDWEEEGIIKYLGTTEDVRPFICACDVFVLPSYREGIPKTNLEAMAMAKPIITTNVPGCRETLEDGKNGFLVSARNSQELAEAMFKMIEMGDGGRKKMGQYGREMILRKFDAKIVIEKYWEIIEEIIFN